MSQGKYRWPTPRGEVTHARDPIPVIVDFRPLPVLPPATMPGTALAWAEDAVYGPIVLVLLESGAKDAKPVWVKAEQVRRADTG